MVCACVHVQEFVCVLGRLTGGVVALIEDIKKRKEQTATDKKIDIEQKESMSPRRKEKVEVEGGGQLPLQAREGWK